MHCVLQSSLKVSPWRYVELPTIQFTEKKTNKGEQWKLCNLKKKLFNWNGIFVIDKFMSLDSCILYIHKVYTNLAMNEFTSTTRPASSQMWIIEMKLQLNWIEQKPWCNSYNFVQSLHLITKFNTIKKINGCWNAPKWQPQFSLNSFSK